MLFVPFSSDPFMLGVSALVFFVLGLCMGSFSSAVAHRACLGESWIVGDGTSKAARSKCPQCGHTLGVFDLIPLLSWVVLLGKCRYCRIKISPVYPFLELMSGLIVVNYFVFFAGLEHPFVKSLLFAVFLPFVTASVMALVKCRGVYPVSLGIMGLLSCAGMVVLSVVF